MQSGFPPLPPPHHQPALHPPAEALLPAALAAAAVGDSLCSRSESCIDQPEFHPAPPPPGKVSWLYCSNDEPSILPCEQGMHRRPSDRCHPQHTCPDSRLTPDRQ